MDIDGNNVTPVTGDTSGTPTVQTPAPPVTTDPPPVTTPPVAPATGEQQVVTKDGKMFIGDREIVYASDLMAAKKGLEGKLGETQQTHDQATTALRQELSGSQDTVAQLTAKLKTAEEASKSGAANIEEVAKLKSELAVANAKVTASEGAVLELKRTHLKTMYNIPEEQLKDKTAVQLEALEEAFKTVRTQSGPGAYALGAGGGGGPVPATPIDRAKAILQNTPVRGVRNP